VRVLKGWEDSEGERERGGERTDRDGETGPCVLGIATLSPIDCCEFKEGGGECGVGEVDAGRYI
jgi:hypothetical protein